MAFNPLYQRLRFRRGRSSRDRVDELEVEVQRLREEAHDAARVLHRTSEYADRCHGLLHKAYEELAALKAAAEERAEAVYEVMLPPRRVPDSAAAGRALPGLPRKRVSWATPLAEVRIVESRRGLGDLMLLLTALLVIAVGWLLIMYHTHF
jgi:hypothetical protein